MKPVTRLYKLTNGRMFRAEDACHALRLFVDVPPRGLKLGTYMLTVVNTGEIVNVKWDGKKATMVWSQE